MSDIQSDIPAGTEASEASEEALTGMTRTLIMGGYRAIQYSGLADAGVPPVIFRPDAESGGDK